MTIQIFTTGGTIDKVYFDAASAYEVGDPQISEILRAAGVAFDAPVEALLQKDSLEMTEADRALVSDRVRACPARHVVVTHGTDTMAETARAVAAALAGDGPPEKTVVFVGSLTPARFKATDAEFNVGFAVAAVQTLPPGVYVAMNGRVFSPETVRKSRERNRFEAGPPDDGGKNLPS
ncbi:MAG TPA: asparaginase domain-containing protein [Rubricoccaceae bacterium]|jgi:L-asparaginase